MSTAKNTDFGLSADDGEVREGPYVDGEKHGHWVTRWDDGSVSEGPYVDGTRHGKWISRYTGGSCYVGDWSYGDQIDSNPC